MNDPIYWGAGAMDEILFTNVSVIDGTGAKPFEGSVLVRGGRIASVTKGDGGADEGTEIVDGGGATLMPGLIDAHAHLSFLDAATLGDINALFDEAGIGTALRRQAERVSDIYRH